MDGKKSPVSLKIKAVKSFLVLVFLPLFFGHASDFSAIDRHADAAPLQLKKSVPALVEYLVRPAKNDLEKVRAIFRWITQNIDYDADSFISRRIVTDEPLKVLEKGQAVCGGFANLFKYMCLATGIKSEVVVGWSKAYGENFGREPNHAWNAVQINYQWYLLDVTWGSGHLTEQLNYKRKFNDHYFLTDPEHFIFDHLPEDDFWQLLERPKSRRQFDNLVLLRPAFFQNGLEIESHTKAKVRAHDHLEISLYAPPNKYTTASLLLGKTEIDANYCFVQRLKNKVNLMMRFPESGDYTLRVFVKDGKNSNTFNWACDYKIDVSNRNIVNYPFARQFAKFIDLDAFLYTPFSFRLDKDQKQTFDIFVEDAIDIAVINDGKINQLQNNNGRFSGNVVLKPGPVQISAKIDNSNTYHWLLEYKAE